MTRPGSGGARAIDAIELGAQPSRDVRAIGVARLRRALRRHFARRHLLKDRFPSLALLASAIAAVASDFEVQAARVRERRCGTSSSWLSGTAERSRRSLRRSAHAQVTDTASAISDSREHARQTHLLNEETIAERPRPTVYGSANASTFAPDVIATYCLPFTV